MEPSVLYASVKLPSLILDAHKPVAGFIQNSSQSCFSSSVYAGKHKRLKWFPYRQRAYGHSEDKARSPETGIVTHLWQPGLRLGIFHPEFKGCRFPFPWLQAYFRDHHTAAAGLPIPGCCPTKPNWKDTEEISISGSWQAKGRP